MAEKHGSLSINSENIFPIIKKWLYSDHDIFARELISNGCDAITKLKKLDVMGEYTLPDDYKAEVQVIVNPEEKTLKFIDTGLGMTADEVEEYITQIAFSGATEFLSKYKDKTTDDQIIGHFGLGFYSAFMVADEVHIDTLSYKEGAAPVHWTCDGGTEYDMQEGNKTTVGTEITLFLNDESTEFSNEYRMREIIEKYCSFMPVNIYLSKENAPQEYETIDEAELRDDDVIVERIHEEAKTEEKENDKKNIKICEKQIQIVQFHPSYSYNEFMETIDARGVNKDGVFKKIASDARNDPDKKYVLIIDEINRANVSEILGELLYGIEYRGQEITTGISNDDFSVPENLYIIGTMNTADRSLQALDYAVRRRFTFKKVKAELPDPKPPKQKEDVKDKGCYEIENGHFFCQNVFKKVQEDVMKSVARGIDPEDIMPGISYFLVNGKNKKTESDPDSYDEDHLKYKMKYELIPLLREYAKNGMFTKRKKLDINEKSLVELLYDNTYFEYLENNLSESEKK